MKLGRYPYLARAFWGEEVVAESEACLYVDRDGQPAVLFFPPSEIELARFEKASHEPVADGVAGPSTPWSIGGQDVLSIVATPPPALAELRGYGTFDTERVRVDVRDGLSGTSPEEVTVKRFPTWGDAADLVDMMDVRPDGDGCFLGLPRSDGRRPVVEGSQMLGQAIVAAGRLAPGRRAVSASMVFLRGADAGHPLRLEIAEHSAGRTFSGLAVQVLQAGRCCAAGIVLLDATAPDLVAHAVAPPDVPGPSECPAYDMGVTGRDLRVVDGAYTDDAGAPVGPPILDCWVRFRDLPDDPALHAGLLAQFTGHMPIAAALRAHEGIGQSQAHRTVSMGINAISLSLHAEVRADRWMLYHHESTFAGDGMTHAECRVHAESGQLLASFTVDAMVRRFGGSGERDGRTAL